MSTEHYFRVKNSLNILILLVTSILITVSQSVKAQTVENSTQSQAPPQDFPRTAPTPQPIPTPGEQLPKPEELLPPSNVNPVTPGDGQSFPGEIQGSIIVERFEFEGSTVFTNQELAEVVKDYVSKTITFAELQQVAQAISKYYNDKGYITTGAYIPAEQESFNRRSAVVKIKILEGTVESIEISGIRRLNPDYVRSRIAIAAGKPLNVKKLLQALQVLQLNPLIKNISAELAQGTNPGASVIDVKIAETKTFNLQATFDNSRVPSIGTLQRKIQLNEANLSGNGDTLSLGYGNTDGSNDYDVSYTLPINPYDGTIELSYSRTTSNVIEEPFNVLDINGRSQEYSITYRQPVFKTPGTEVALGLTASRRESDIGFLNNLVGRREAFPSPGARDGETKLSVIRFFQEFTDRNEKQVFAARSQFNLGTGAFEATNNATAPDGEFFSWRGQAQYVRLLAPDTILLLRTDAQLADRALVPLEQFGLGGQQTVRGYRQDLLLSDSAFFASAEVRYPIVRLPQLGGILYLTPFVDFGAVSNVSASGRQALDPSTIVSTGLGLNWQSSQFNARLDWGIPLVDVNSSNNTLQEDGLHFSLNYIQPF
jgi:hemolysin activation/secretion protein